MSITSLLGAIAAPPASPASAPPSPPSPSSSSSTTSSPPSPAASSSSSSQSSSKSAEPITLPIAKRSIEGAATASRSLPPPPPPSLSPAPVAAATSAAAPSAAGSAAAEDSSASAVCVAVSGGVSVAAGLTAGLGRASTSGINGGSGESALASDSFASMPGSSSVKRSTLASHEGSLLDGALPPSVALLLLAAAAFFAGRPRLRFPSGAGTPPLLPLPLPSAWPATPGVASLLPGGAALARFRLWRVPPPAPTTPHA